MYEHNMIIFLSGFLLQNEREREKGERERDREKERGGRKRGGERERNGKLLVCLFLFD